MSGELEIMDTSSLDSPEFVYNMKYPKRGKFIIINNKTFLPITGIHACSGTDKDEANLFKIFQKFGFDVTLENNVTAKRMQMLMDEAAEEDHSNCDCFGVAVLSYGDDGDIYGTDGVISIEKFVAPIKECITLNGKPKIFLFPACEKLESGQQTDAISHSPSGTGNPTIPGPIMQEEQQPIGETVHGEADILYAYFTVPDKCSKPNSSRESLFLKALKYFLSKPDSRYMDFVRVITRVNHAIASRPEMNRKKQTPSVMSRLRMDLYLGPK